jgi:hypothetical protein
MKCAKNGDLWKITLEMNDSKESSVQVFSSLQRNISE